MNACSTYNTLLNFGSSTCIGIELNCTGYWAPAMFDAKNSVRIPSKIIIYYKGYGQANGKSEAYLAGATMVVKDEVHRLIDGDTAGIATATNFMCSD